jgi:hypothetical protein
LNKAVPNVILPPPLNLLDDKAESDTRLKPKRKQEVRKRGPIKAVVPVDNMTRASGLGKKGEEFLLRMFFSSTLMDKQWMIPSQCYRYCSYQISSYGRDCEERSGGCQDAVHMHSSFLWLKKDTQYLQ